MKATQLIEDGYRRCNRLSPGEVLNADDLDRGLDDLNVIVDELSVKERFLFKSVFTSAVQSSNITLGIGSWAALPPGIEIFGAYSDNVPLDYTTPERFAAVRLPATTGVPHMWTYDGFNAVSLYPVPTGQTIKLRTGSSVSTFADLETDYTLVPGYRAYLGARLAVKLHPSIAKLTAAEIAELRLEERRAAQAIQEIRPAVIDLTSYSPSRYRETVSDPYGWR